MNFQKAAQYLQILWSRSHADVWKVSKKNRVLQGPYQILCWIQCSKFPCVSYVFRGEWIQFDAKAAPPFLTILSNPSHMLGKRKSFFPITLVGNDEFPNPVESTFQFNSFKNLFVGLCRPRALEKQTGKSPAYQKLPSSESYETGCCHIALIYSFISMCLSFFTYITV